MIRVLVVDDLPAARAGLRVLLRSKSDIDIAGEASSGPAAVAMAEAYLLDQKRLLPVAAYLDGEYGYKDLFMGVPCIVGGNGVEKIVEIPLTDEEKGMLAKSAASVQSVVDVVKKS